MTLSAWPLQSLSGVINSSAQLETEVSKPQVKVLQFLTKPCTIPTATLQPSLGNMAPPRVEGSYSLKIHL